MSRHVWVAQCLDPDRHCILAALGEADGRPEAESAVAAPLRRQVEELVRQGLINPWCGLCGAARVLWRIEIDRTRWRTMEEAEADPLFHAIRAANDASRDAGKSRYGRPGRTLGHNIW